MYSRNIPSLYIIKFSKWFSLILPIIGLYYKDLGFSGYELLFAQACYSASTAIMEIPSGYFADVLGRKKTLLGGSIMATIGFLIYTLHPSFTGFIIAEIILGIGASFISGSDSAMLYDSLIADKKEGMYLKHEGVITSLGNFSETAAALIGGSIAILIGFEGTYAVQILIAFSAVPAALFLKEPPRHGKLNKLRIKDIIDISKHSIFTHKILSRSIFMSSIVGLATLSMAWNMQIFFINYDFNENQTTFYWTLLNLTVACFALLASPIRKMLGEIGTLLIILISVPFGYAILSQLQWQWAIVLIFIFYAVRGFATPVLKDYINKNCESNVRATVLSIRSLVIRLGFSIIMPILGYLSTNYSFNNAMLVAFLFFSVGIGISGYRFLSILIRDQNNIS